MKVEAKSNTRDYGNICVESTYLPKLAYYGLIRVNKKIQTSLQLGLIHLEQAISTTFIPILNPFQTPSCLVFTPLQATTANYPRMTRFTGDRLLLKLLPLLNKHI